VGISRTLRLGVGLALGGRLGITLGMALGITLGGLRNLYWIWQSLGNAEPAELEMSIAGTARMGVLTGSVIRVLIAA